ncbi:NADPH-dependent F420 reductase [Brachybacterium sp. GU-2]|uniref:NADPH-dependent F420 reductase n=1 Tax=Brachybacterium sp. GU-2 TaxID=3069708 RepID=UPI00280C1874|nr:NADPH-dependent F420 reductase [Brachybacterium sp. GU-2]WME22717.1 NADPH-dependent F420 reductase [Brachybacterium sp. GU-2]
MSTTVTVIGSGNVGSAVAALAAKGGAQVQVLGRDQDKAAALAAEVSGTAGAIGEAITGEIVVLAVPVTAFDELVAAYGAQLEGKVVVDVTNPVDFATFDSLTVPADSSAAAELQAKLPGAKVVKAFNTLFAGVLAAGQVGGDVPAVVLVAGDDESAKSALIELVTAGGVKGVDAGSLKRAREMEAVGFLQMTLAAREIIGWTGGFALRG